MKHNDFQGYGDIKQWYWACRSDVCVNTSQAVTIGTVYITPWTQDTPMIIFPAVGLRFKFDYDIDTSGNWELYLHFGVYKLLKGTSGATQTLELLPYSSMTQWAGVGAASGTFYDTSTATALSTNRVFPITDGALFCAFLWTYVLSDFGSVTVTSYGTTLPSGTWLYTNSGVAGAGALPQTINSIPGSAKVFQEHWISEY